MIEGIINIVLDEDEQDLIQEHLWQNKTLNDLADGRWQIYTERGLIKKKNRTIDKLIKGNILDCSP